VSAATLHGEYYDGRHPLGVAATLALGGGAAELTHGGGAQRWPVAALRVSPRIARAARFVDLPGGGQFQCPDHPALDALPQEEPGEGLVAWLEQRTAVALAGVALIAALVLGGYFYGLPALAERVVAHVPIESERALGEQALEWLDANEWFEPTEVDADMQELIRDDFARLTDDLPFAPHYRLEFRSAGFLGANALALPGGVVVLTDGMVDAAETTDELAAVLAHEIGHVERRHSLRHLLQGSVVAAVTTTVTADAASLSVAVAGAPALLAQLSYSRAFETEADDFAFELLRRHDLSPEAFATLMERLAGKGEEEGDGDDSGFLSTHPVAAERAQRARAAAQP
jgi:predicted Zn-dependent protease